MTFLDQNDMPTPEQAHTVLRHVLGRRRLLASTSAADALGLGALAAPGQADATPRTSGTSLAPASPGGVLSREVLEPGKGPIPGDAYLPSRTDEVTWGYVPTVHSSPVARVRSGRTITIGAISHEGLLEDQGRDPIAFFGEDGVARRNVLTDAVDVATHYDRHTRSFDTDGPHVVTGPVFVEGAEAGDVLRIETVDLRTRVPYGVVSSRHGKGTLAVTAAGEAPAGISMDEVMPPHSTDGRSTHEPTDYGNVSVFADIHQGQARMRAGRRSIHFPPQLFFGMMGVARADATAIYDPSANSVPPTLGGGNIDIRHLGLGSTFYLPVADDGTLFYVGDPHHAMGSGEVALTAMEGSLRGTFRLTVCKKGSGDAPDVAFRYPFGETANAWIPIGLSDPDGLSNGSQSDLNIAMRRAVVNALDFLELELDVPRPVAYAYLSAASDFYVSQFVDKTTGVHGLVRKADFR